MFEKIADTYVSGIITSLALKTDISFGIIVAGVVLVALISYFLGSLNFALILSKKMYGEDIRNYGSKNAGTTNMMRTYGKKAALFTILGDIAKGIVAVLMGSFLMGAILGGYIAGLFCIIGHVFPVFYNFKGGKGVATAAAVILVVNPLVFLIMITVFVVTVLLTRYVSLGSCLGAAIFPLLTFYSLFGNMQIVLHYSGVAFICAFAMAVLVICKHHTNLKRLANGTESKFSFKKSKDVVKEHEIDNKKYTARKKK